MANAGDTYTTILKEAHLKWGIHRYTYTRDRIYGEGYLLIPIKFARLFSIYNSNATKGKDVLGVNIFNCTSRDGLFEAQLKAQGCSRAGSQYAKQFSANDDLKAIGSWFSTIGAQVGDKIKVTWTSPTDIVIERI